MSSNAVYFQNAGPQSMIVEILVIFNYTNAIQPIAHNCTNEWQSPEGFYADSVFASSVPFQLWIGSWNELEYRNVNE